MNWEPYHTKDIKEEYLIKFVPLSRLKDFLKSGEIWFSRADKFGDKLECIRISDFENKSLNHNDLKKRQKKILVSCWHLADIESVAMWDTYSNKTADRKNIAIRFKRKYLIELIEINLTNKFKILPELIHGKVQYRNLINYKEQRISKTQVKHSVFRKENAFNYEKEYRLVIKYEDSYIDEGYGYKIGKTEDLTFDILINPLLKNELASEVRNKIKELGFSKNIKESQLNLWFQHKDT
ncbi:hypothetical protein J2X31_000262 [Flavobacterium arsenatis]|uniref:DUF2971 domain-containing protein n=1 Tax=Flavobacterium arsenatis TaxID=1484332 RepID=A0ABU1TJV6_9FLAO|nr:DUF2971 domain-containing protein [Flavobacterium arsenatis]MDR6966269.1 hypothetical protein [Flavobacterium arsenatis]